MTIAIVKYNAGNIRSVTYALQRLGIEPCISDDADTLRSADKVIFPGPRPNQVSISVEAIGVNFADIKRRRGASKRGGDPPFVPGIEASGVVYSVGEGAAHEPGDRVVAYVPRGAYAEYVIADDDRVFDVPDGMTFDEAAGFPVQFITAHNALFEWGGLVEGERALVHAAAGGVGSAAVQLARSIGSEVFATASTDRKLAFAAELGADHLLDYTETAFEDEIAQLTDERGVDLALDGVGGRVFEDSLGALAPFGRLVSVGSASGSEGSIDPSLLRVENQQVIGYHLGTAMEYSRERVVPALPHLYELFETGEIAVKLGRTFSLEEAARAHEHVESRQSIGKVILQP